MKFAILQAREEHQRDLMFRRLENIGAVDLGKYEAVYSGCVHDVGDDEAVLENLYRTFNIDRPADYRGMSMSVGHVVLLDGCRLWFCDSFGFTALTGENAPVAKSPLVLDVGAGR